MNATGPSAGSPTGPPARVNPSIADRHPPHRRQLHEEIVRMLAIDQRLAVERLADLKDLAVAVRADRRRIQAEHAGERQPAAWHVSRLAIPIHQFGATNSSPPRGPPWLLNTAKRTPSCMNCQPRPRACSCAHDRGRILRVHRN